MYDVVVMNEGLERWIGLKRLRKLLKIIWQMAGGMVSIHAANNCWPKWKEYNKMTGLGGWGGRNEKSGPYLYK